MVVAKFTAGSYAGGFEDGKIELIKEEMLLGNCRMTN
jgi:hypothetical protein